MTAMMTTEAPPRTAGAAVHTQDAHASAGELPCYTPAAIRDLVCAWVQEGLTQGLDGPAAGECAIKRVIEAGLLNVLVEGYGGELAYGLWLRYRAQGSRMRLWHGSGEDQRGQLRHDVRSLGTDDLWMVPFYVGDGQYVPFGDMTRVHAAYHEQRATRRIAHERQRQGFWAQLRVSLPEGKTLREHFSQEAVVGLLRKHGFRKLHDAAAEPKVEEREETLPMSRLKPEGSVPASPAPRRRDAAAEPKDAEREEPPAGGGVKPNQYVPASSTPRPRGVRP